MFEDWPQDIHYNYEQVQRIASARDKKLEKRIIRINREIPSITIQGSGDEPYFATLKECTCTDFKYRALPCKHMYRLAIELSLLPDLPSYDKKKSNFNPDIEIERYKELYLHGQISAETYVNVCKALAKL